MDIEVLAANLELLDNVLEVAELRIVLAEEFLETRFMLYKLLMHCLHGLFCLLNHVHMRREVLSVLSEGSFGLEYTSTQACWVISEVVGRHCPSSCTSTSSSVEIILDSGPRGSQRWSRCS